MHNDYNDKYYSAVRNLLANTPNLEMSLSCKLLSEHDAESRKYVAKNLTEFRKNLRLSQSKLACLLNVSLSQYKKYETASETIRLDVAQRLSLKCGLPIFMLLKGSKYAEFINLPNDYEDFDLIWFYANSVTDKYFKKLCEILLCFTREEGQSIVLENSGVSAEDFVLAIEENHDEIYYAIAQGIKAARHHFNVSQEQVAYSLEVSLSAYQEYEKPTSRPRFNLFVPARYTIGTNLNPFVVLVGTHYARIRKMQNSRIETIQKILADIEPEVLACLPPLVEGFYETVKSLSGSLYFKI